MVSQKIVDDLKVSAFEGGINYWAQIREAANSKRDAELNYLGDWKIIEVGDFTDPADFRSHVLSDTKLRKGIQKAAEHLGLTVARFYDEHDAEYADLAVQFALFGQIVYS